MLVQKGKTRNFITETELLYAFGELEEYIPILEEFLDDLLVLGVQVIETGGEMLGKRKEFSVILGRSKEGVKPRATTAKTKAKTAEVEKVDDAHFIVKVKAPPVDGRANIAIIEALAVHFNTGQSRVRLVSGAVSKQKVFEIA